MDLEEMGINAGNWADSALDRNYWRAVVNAALNLRVPVSMELVNNSPFACELRILLVIHSHSDNLQWIYLHLRGFMSIFKLMEYNGMYKIICNFKFVSIAGPTINI